jgi:glyoxylase-like metal-dependent hydrolase (beta-lactamase superfamily II)
MLLARRLALFAAAAAVAIAAPAAAQRRAAAPDIKLYAMDCGRGTFPDADAFSDDGAYKGKPATMVVPCYLIRHPKGDLIWDTGVPQSLADQPGGGAGALKVQRKLTDQLKELGLTPADIEYLSISHSHFDHIGNAGLFAGSTWIVDPDEKAYAFRPQARADKINFPAYSALEGSKTILVEKPSYDVFGDGSVVVWQAPGHTPGHTVLLVRLRQAGAVLLTGDMWHIAESRAARRVPRFNTDRAQTLASMDLVEKLAADNKARVVREHVPEDFDSLPKFPAALR